MKSAANKSSFSRLHKWGITKCPGGRERNLRRSSLRGKVRTRTPSWLKIIRLPSNVVVGGEICVIRGYISLRNQRNLRLKNSCQFVSIFFVPLCLSGISTTVEDSLQIHPFYAKQTQFTKCSNKRMLSISNGLCQFTPVQPLQKQSQFKPNQTQYKANQSQNKANTNPIC